MTVGRPAPALDDTAARGRRTLAGLALALAFHILFLGLIVFRLTGKPPPVVEAAEAPAVSVSLVHGPATVSKPQADEAEAAASAPSLLPVRDTPAAPPPPDPMSAKPRPADAEPQALSAQTPAEAPDLAREPTPLHRRAEAGPPSTGAAPPTGGAPDCRLGSAVQRVLQEDPDVLGAVARLPRQSRSVANAVVLWQGVWSSDQPVPVIRSALQATIRQTTAACRDQPMRGPQFMTVSEGGGATVLVIGSGDWTWGQLLR